MQDKIISTINSTFAEDVHKGLTDFPKHLSSKYFYDERGDRLFQDIMQMPEYYLTNREFDILSQHKKEIVEWFARETDSINLIELGAGDGKKTKILLEHMSGQNLDFKYIPIDISQNALDSLERTIGEELPAVEVEPRQGMYFEVLQHLSNYNHSKKVILFLGSNIGNLLHADAVDFLRQIQEVMGENDLLFVGFDQKKDPQTILDAYNDPAGITEDFNKNILRRINNELGGNFKLENFLHWEVYDPESGTAKSYLVAKTKQKVYIKTLELEVNFNAWETIHTEISQKYNDEVVAWLAQQSGLNIVAEFSDPEKTYKDYLFKKS